MCFYSSNFVHIAWNGVLSQYFLAINGVKQGGVLSPIINSIYNDGLMLVCFRGNLEFPGEFPPAICLEVALPASIGERGTQCF